MNEAQPSPNERASLRVTVLGAGVIGLTTAHVLERAGYAVRIVADRCAERTTSRVAGAIWFPYLVDRDARVPAWARDSYEWLVAGSSEPGFGVRGTVPTFLLEDARRGESGLRAALPAGIELVWSDLTELPLLARKHGERSGAGGAWVFRAPVVTPAEHLSWLRASLTNCSFEETAVLSLAAPPGEILVNCTGRRARALTHDEDLVPALGQLIVATDEHLPRDYAFADDRNKDELIYLVPRGREVVLGGYSARVAASDPAPWTQPESPAADAAIGRGILERFERAGLAPLHQIEQRAEWRPARVSETVRVEADDHLAGVLHNYGHGGSGFTLAYGCARAVLELIERA